MNIFFDLDGTLLDVSKKYHLAHTLAAKKNKLKPLSFKRYWTLKRRKISEDRIIKLDPLLKTFKLYEDERIKLLENQTILKNDQLFAGIKDLLEKLKKNSTLYLITLRKNRRSLKDELSRLGIRAYFKTILSASPSNHPVQTKISLLKKVKFSKEDIMVGDTEVDIITAKKMGIRSVAVMSGIRTRNSLNQFRPDFLIENVLKIPFIESFLFLR